MTTTDFTHNLGLRFRSVAAAHAGRPALRFTDGGEVTFAQLDALSERLARLLSANGVLGGEVVLLVNRKTRFGYAAMLACLKLGAPYVNVDPANPAARLKHVFRAARPRLCVFEGDLPESVREAKGEFDCASLDLAAPATTRELDGLPDGPIPDASAVTGAAVAYLMFTSGSTGTPKGAAVSHDNVASLIGWSLGRFGFGPGDVLTGANPIYFDNSVFDFYSALFSGACLAPFDQEVVANPKALVEAVDTAGCTTWFSVPSLLIYLNTVRMLGPETFKSLRLIVFGGEGYPKSELKKLWALYGERATLVNVYGPTECTCICSAYDIGPADLEGDRGLPPLGHMNPNFGSLVLDDDRRVAAGETGELCLLGPSVCLGYYNDPERTATSFQQNPLNPAYRDIMYRTGDLVRLNPDDGLFYFVGRKDHQIKHMGYRIELEEIEAALNHLEAVVQAAVVYRRIRDAYGEIVAFVSVENPVEADALRDALKRTLPSYMLPKRIEIRDSLPKNPNGKIDRVRLAQELESV